MDTPLPSPGLITGLGFLLGTVFGVVASRANFCTMGAVADVVAMGNWNRMRMWWLAMAVAILGAQGLQLAGWVDLGKSIYTGPRLLWLSHLVGGALFGVGMTLASGCGSRLVLRLGAGNLKSLVVAVFLGVAAYATLRGVLAPLRVGVLESVSYQMAGPQDLPHLLGRLGVPAPFAAQGLPFLLGVLLLLLAVGPRQARTAHVILGGAGVGLLVAAGWFVTGYLGYVPEHPDTLEEAFIATNSGRAESLSMVAPFAYLLDLLMLWTDKSRGLSFGIATMLGMLAGAWGNALATRSFRVESFRDGADLLRHIAGGVLMGFGGVTAMGCTVGQGISGVSTLAVGAFLTWVGIVAGCFVQMKYEYWRLERAG